MDIVPRGRRAWRGLRPYVDGRVLALRTTSVHTFGMREPLKVVAVDREGTVIANVVVPPRRIVWNRGAHWIIEMSVSEPGPEVGSVVPALPSRR